MDGAWIPPDLPVVVEQRGRPEGQAWLRALPGLIEVAIERWGLDVGAPFRSGSAAWAAPATVRANGTEAVLKITVPHREARAEARALRVWNGCGAVRLYEEDVYRWSLLVERCRPGTALADDHASVDERLAAGCELLVSLWDQAIAVADGFETLAGVCDEWAALVRERMAAHRSDLDPGLVETGARLLESLPASATRDVLLHGDFNPTNVLRAERQTWLAIDPKPMTGDPAYDVVPLAAQIQPAAASDPADLRRTFTVAAALAGEPSERVLAWAVGRAVESALWYSANAEDAQAEETMRHARVFADLAGV